MHPDDISVQLIDIHDFLNRFLPSIKEIVEFRERTGLLIFSE